mmetsp:Transcript_36976/g.114175  ORF Transcript_36976/g.114175 Transcript_36976/m.114175 type:complete len:424 (-) Transcript_36976:56-1327(-)
MCSSRALPSPKTSCPAYGSMMRTLLAMSAGAGSGFSSSCASCRSCSTASGDSFISLSSGFFFFFFFMPGMSRRIAPAGSDIVTRLRVSASSSSANAALLKMSARPRRFRSKSRLRFSESSLLRRFSLRYGIAGACMPPALATLMLACCCARIIVGMLSHRLLLSLPPFVSGPSVRVSIFRRRPTNLALRSASSSLTRASSSAFSSCSFLRAFHPVSSFHRSSSSSTACAPALVNRGGTLPEHAISAFGYCSAHSPTDCHATRVGTMICTTSPSPITVRTRVSVASLTEMGLYSANSRGLRSLRMIVIVLSRCVDTSRVMKAPRTTMDRHCSSSVSWNCGEGCSGQYSFSMKKGWLRTSATCFDAKWLYNTCMPWLKRSAPRAYHRFSWTPSTVGVPDRMPRAMVNAALDVAALMARCAYVKPF